MVVLNVFAQNIQLSNNEGIIQNNSEIIQAGSPNIAELVTYMNVKNTTSASMKILCRKTEMILLDSTEVTMCWGGACWPSKIHLSPEPTIIAAGATSNEFVGHYSQVLFQHFKPGESVFDMDKPSDSTTVVIKYLSWPLNVPEIAARPEMSSIYPNPASAQAWFSLDIPKGTNATLIIRDMLGKSVFTQSDLSSGKTQVNTSAFNDGIYFCTLMADGKMIETRKLVVKH
jgi:hypothetical protein